ncbi:MAG: YggT family protein [Endozoicomonadaceae bacterium]|nr:YggT family protein [Endozoicomonadaceae bacterium]
MLQILVGILGNWFVLMIILRFILQAVNADYYNPFSQIIVKSTNSILKPIRMIIPKHKIDLDFASILVAFLMSAIVITSQMYLIGLVQIPMIFIIKLSVLQVIRLILDFYFYSILIVSLSSWIAPLFSHSALVFLNQILQPLSNYLRRFLPFLTIGRVDLSFMVITFIILFIRNMVPALYIL